MQAVHAWEEAGCRWQVTASKQRQLVPQHNKEVMTIYNVQSFDHQTSYGNAPLGAPDLGAKQLGSNEAEAHDCEWTRRALPSLFKATNVRPPVRCMISDPF